LTYKTFLDCGYALLVEFYLRIPGTDLLTAVQQVENSLSDEPLSPRQEAQAAEYVPTAAENDAALRELQKMTSGLGAFGV